MLGAQLVYQSDRLNGVMSPFGPQRTSLVAPHMSVFGGKADTGSLTGECRRTAHGSRARYARIALVKSAPLPTCKIQAPLVLASLVAWAL